MRTRTEGTAKPRAPLQSRILCQACALSAFFCRPGSGARSVGRRTVPSSNPVPRAHACLGLDCHEFSSTPSHAQACKRLVVAAVARALCAPHRQPLPSSTRRSTLLVRRPSNCRCSAARRGGTAPGRHGHQTTPCRKPWRARVCRSTSRPAHPITELTPILSLNLDMSACRPRRRGTAVAARRQHRALSCARGSKSALVGFRHGKSFAAPVLTFGTGVNLPLTFRMSPSRDALDWGTGLKGELEKPPKSDSFSYEHRNSGRSSKELTAEHAGQGAGHGAWWAVDARVVASGLYVLSWYTLSCNAAQHLPRAPERVRTLWCMRKGT